MYVVISAHSSCCQQQQLGVTSTTANKSQQQQRGAVIGAAAVNCVQSIMGSQDEAADTDDVTSTAPAHVESHRQGNDVRASLRSEM